MDSFNISKINYMFVPSLKRLALVKIASTLWYKTDMRHLISDNFSCNSNTSKYGQIIENKVSELKLPVLLEKLLIPYIYRVGFQILDWIEFHVVECGYVPFTELPSEFIWTPQSTIDCKKLAETLVYNEKIDIYNRFKLACTYCLEDSIRLLWKQLPNNFYKKRFADSIVMFWSYYMAGEIDHLYKDFNFPLEPEGADDLTPFQLAFKISVCTGNQTATKYFLHRLTSKERHKMLAANANLDCSISSFNPNGLKLFSPYHLANNYCYLFFEMKEHEQAALIKDHAITLFRNLLIWPWQSFFISTAKRMWNELVKEDYLNVVYMISNKIYSETKVYDYQKLFGEFWQLGSTAFKRHVIINKGLNALSYVLCKVGDKENTKLIFDAATVLEKEKFIFSPKGQMRCRNLIEIGNWSFLKFFIQECTSSKEVFNKLKVILIKVFYTMKEYSNISNEFYQLLTDIEQKHKRKYIVDDVNNLSKKFHSSS